MRILKFFVAVVIFIPSMLIGGWVIILDDTLLRRKTKDEYWSNPFTHYMFWSHCEIFCHGNKDEQKV